MVLFQPYSKGFFQYFSQHCNIPFIPVFVEGWGANASRSLAEYVTPSQETAVIAERSCCSQPLLLLIIVCSGVGNFLERDAIRDTWGNFSNPDYKVVFLLGLTDNVTIQVRLVTFYTYCIIQICGVHIKIRMRLGTTFLGGKRQTLHNSSV